MARLVKSCPCLSKFSCKGRRIGIARCENRDEMQLRGVCNAGLIGTISAPWADEIAAVAATISAHDAQNLILLVESGLRV